MYIPIFFNKRSNIFFLFICLVLMLFISAIDYFSGEEISSAIFYLLPISIAAWYAGRWSGLLISFISAVILVYIDFLTRKTYLHPFIHIWNTLGIFGFFWIMTYTLSALKKSLEYEKEMARTDPLTELVNRRHFHELADKEIIRMLRFKRPFTVAYIDIDDFKAVNDSFGHSEGDNLLRSIAITMQNELRETDVIARLGGDEFAVLMPETDYDSAQMVLPKMQEMLLKAVKRKKWGVTFSIGVMTFITPPGSVEEMVKIVDHLMYSVKKRGKDQMKHDMFGEHEVSER